MDGQEEAVVRLRDEQYVRGIYAYMYIIGRARVGFQEGLGFGIGFGF